MFDEKDQMELPTVEIYKPTGEELRDKGIAQAINHADDEFPKWSEGAYSILLNYVDCTPEGFMGEDIRLHAEKIGYPVPPSKRAWGAVIIRAAKAGIITKVGYSQVTNANAHKANASLWAGQKMFAMVENWQNGSKHVSEAD